RQSLVARRGDDVEIAHGALVKSWAHLEAKRGAELERCVFMEQLREAAIAWDRAGNAEELLWLGQNLREVDRHRDLIARVSGTETEFVAASRAKARRRALWRAASIAALVIALIGIGLAKWAADESQARADALRVAAEERAYLADIVAKSRRTED